MLPLGCARALHLVLLVNSTGMWLCHVTENRFYQTNFIEYRIGWVPTCMLDNKLQENSLIHSR